MKVDCEIKADGKDWLVTETRVDGNSRPARRLCGSKDELIRIEHDDLSPRHALRRWIPTPTDLNEEFELTITLPEDYVQLLGNGTYADRKLTWKNIHRLDPYFVAGTTRTVHEHPAEVRERRVPIRVLTREDGPSPEAVAKYAEQCLIVLADWLEVPFPHPRLDIDLRASHPMEYPGVVRCGVRDLPHELVHQWFGCHARAASDDGMWFDEAVAEALTEREVQPYHPHRGTLRATFKGGELATTPRGAYTYGAWALSHLSRADLQASLKGILKKGYWTGRAVKGLDTWIGGTFDATEPKLLRPDGPRIPNHHRLRFEPFTIKNAIAPQNLVGRAGAGGRAQIWDGPTWAKNSSDVIIAVGYRSPTVDDQATEWWALAPGVRLNVDTGTITRTFVSPSGPDPVVYNLESFKDWAEAHLDLTDAEIFEHQVTVHQ